MKCEHCSSEFEPRRDWQRFCQSKCRREAWVKRHPRYYAEYKIDMPQIPGTSQKYALVPVD